MPKPSCLTDYVLICMRDGEWWTFWKLQRVIEEKVRKEKELEYYTLQLEELQKKRRDAMGMDFTTAADLLAIDEEIEKLKN